MPKEMECDKWDGNACFNFLINDEFVDEENNDQTEMKGFICEVNTYVPE